MGPASTARFLLGGACFKKAWTDRSAVEPGGPRAEAAGRRLQAAGSRAAFSLFPPASYSLQPIVYSLFLGTSASPIATESFRYLADKILVPKRPPRIMSAAALRKHPLADPAGRDGSVGNGKSVAGVVLNRPREYAPAAVRLPGLCEGHTRAERTSLQRLRRGWWRLGRGHRQGNLCH